MVLDAVLLKGLRAAGSQPRNEASGSVEEPPPLAWVDSLTGDVLVGQRAAVSAERSRLNLRRAVGAPPSEAEARAVPPAPPAAAAPAPAAPAPARGAHSPPALPPRRLSLAARLSKRLSPGGALEHNTTADQRSAARKATHVKAGSPPPAGAYVEGSLVDQMQHLEHEKPHGVKGLMYLMQLDK
jgi:hypothetical protein